MVWTFNEGGVGMVDEVEEIDESIESEQSDAASLVSASDGETTLQELERVSDHDATFPYDIEEAMEEINGEEIEHQENSSPGEESDVSEPESVHSTGEESASSDDSTGSEGGFVRRSVRATRPPARYSPS